MGSSALRRALICRGLVGLAAISLVSVGAAQNQGFAQGSAPYIKIRLVRAKEIRGANVIVHAGGSGTTTVTANVLALTYRFMTGPDLTGSASTDGGSGGGGGGVQPPSEESSALEGLAIDPISPPGGGNPGGGPGGFAPAYWIRIPNAVAPNSPGRLGFLTSPANQVQAFPYVSLSGPASSEPGLRVRIDPGQEVTICYLRPSSPVLPTAGGRIMVTWATSNGIPGQANLTNQEIVYVFHRRDGFGDASVSSRKGYGQPNRDGQFPGDPNADFRNLNFGDWVFRGGMFVGNMPSGSNDRSGVARAQFFTSTVMNQLTAPRMTVFTAYQIGRPANVNGAVSIGLFGALTSNETEATATWENRFNINPRASVPSGESPSPDKDPLLRFNIGANESDGLLSGSITRVYDVGTPSPEDPNIITYTTYYSTPVSGALALAVHDEQTLVNWGWQGWRYIASKEYLGSLPASHGLNYTDIAPRIWNIHVDEIYNQMGLNQGWSWF